MCDLKYVFSVPSYSYSNIHQQSRSFHCSEQQNFQEGTSVTTFRARHCAEAGQLWPSSSLPRASTRARDECKSSSRCSPLFTRKYCRSDFPLVDLSVIKGERRYRTGHRSVSHRRDWSDEVAGRCEDEAYNHPVNRPTPQPMDITMEKHHPRRFKAASSLYNLPTTRESSELLLVHLLELGLVWSM